MSIKPRCTFAIISHPDAGKTTMTEKLLWFGGVVREAGMVKSKSGDYAKSDWMELEKQRGISITSSVMSFEYNDRAFISWILRGTKISQKTLTVHLLQLSQC